MYDELLREVSTDDLAIELKERLVREKGVIVWPLEVFNLVRAIALIPCVDAFLMRRGDGKPEMGFILRNTGLYKGRWWDVGGRLNIGESMSQALDRHVWETLGVGFDLAPGLTWNKPVLVGQYGPERFSLAEEEVAGHEPSKWVIVPTYLIQLRSENFTFGSTVHGGQEATAVKWFPLDTLPSEEEIAYGGKDTVRICAEWIRANLR